MKKILFFAETVTLAHMARCVIIADELHKAGKYCVGFAADSRFDSIIEIKEYMRFQLYTVKSDYFFNRLAKGLPIYDEQKLTDYVKEDIEVIEKFKPDFIIGDFRLSLAISSKIAKVPYATITNAYWSPYADIDYPIPEIPLTKIFGVSIAQKLFNLARPMVFWIHSLAFNRACKKFRQLPLAYDMREVYTHADYTLYADIESLFCMKPLPKNHLFIGPVLWSADVVLPPWWDNLPKTKPIVFVTLGSSGDSSLLPMILKTLGSMEVTVICVTAQKADIESPYANVFVTDFLPAEAAVKKADIVICNGGSPMVYQSLIENKAIIGIPSNLDQYLMMTVLQKADKGQLVRAGLANPDLIRLAVNQALVCKPLPLAAKPLLAIDKIMALIDAI